jgi:glycosyltransferase involved in cell wall biosynthesis
VYDAMNKALKVVTGDFVYFIGADDILLVDFNQIKFAQYRGNIVYGNVRFHCDGPDDGLIYNGEFSKYKLAKMNICHQAIFYPKEVFQTYHYETRYRAFADYYLNLCLWRSGYHFCYIPCIIAQFNLGGISGNGDAAFWHDARRIKYECLGLRAVVYAMICRQLKKITSPSVRTWFRSTFSLFDKL